MSLQFSCLASIGTIVFPTFSFILPQEATHQGCVMHDDAYPASSEACQMKVLVTYMIMILLKKLVRQEVLTAPPRKPENSASCILL